MDESANHVLVDNAGVKADAAALLPSVSGMEPLRPHEFVIWLRIGAVLPYAFRAGKTSHFYSTLEELAAELAQRKAARLWGLPPLHGLREPGEDLGIEEATRVVRLARARQNASDDIVTLLGMPDADFDFEPPRAEFNSRAVEFDCDEQGAEGDVQPAAVDVREHSRDYACLVLAEDALAGLRDVAAGCYVTDDELDRALGIKGAAGECSDAASASGAQEP